MWLTKKNKRLFDISQEEIGEVSQMDIVITSQLAQIFICMFMYLNLCSVPTDKDRTQASKPPPC